MKLDKATFVFLEWLVINIHITEVLVQYCTVCKPSYFMKLIHASFFKSEKNVIIRFTNIII